MMPGQHALIREIIVDNFAGGGGASTGIEWALGGTAVGGLACALVRANVGYLAGIELESAAA